MEEHSKEKVLITGITGFTGIHLEKSLKELGFLVYGTTLSVTTSKNHFKCDILEEDMLIDVLNEVTPDYIIHLAAISFVAAKDQKSIYNVNIFGTLNLLNAIERLKIQPKKILIASSAAVYGNIEGELHEELCPMPVNHYGNSKLVMENMVNQYFDHLNIIIVRPFNYTGVGQEPNFLIPKIVSHFKNRLPFIELGNLDTLREYNDVKFVTEIYVNLLQSAFKSGVVNVSSGKTHSIGVILKTMEKISNQSIQVKVNPEFIRPNEIKELKGSTIQLKKILKKEFKSSSLEDTLREMFNS
jgi:nucleoside-diphosphate-sugar epimerase